MQAQGGLQPTGGLRVATLVLIWLATAASGLQLLAIYQRRSVWDDRAASFADLVDADNAVAGAFILYGLLALAAGIVLSIWTLRSVHNSQKLGTQRLRPGLACGGWYIPFGNVVVPYIQIRRAAGGLGAPTVGVWVWQLGWGAMVLGGLLVNTAFDEAGSLDAGAIRDDLSTQVMGASITFVAAIIAAAGATIATRALDAAIEARAGG